MRVGWRRGEIAAFGAWRKSGDKSLSSKVQGAGRKSGDESPHSKAGGKAAACRGRAVGHRLLKP